MAIADLFGRIPFAEGFELFKEESLWLVAYAIAMSVYGIFV